VSACGLIKVAAGDSLSQNVNRARTELNGSGWQLHVTAPRASSNRRVLTRNKPSECEVSTDAKLAKVLAEAQEYLDLAIEALESEREIYKRIMELHLEIARELERLSDERFEEIASRRTARWTNEGSGKVDGQNSAATQIRAFQTDSAQSSRSRHG
jgi:hypothetical protein